LILDILLDSRFILQLRFLAVNLIHKIAKLVIGCAVGFSRLGRTTIGFRMKLQILASQNRVKKKYKMCSRGGKQQNQPPSNKINTKNVFAILIYFKNYNDDVSHIRELKS
jgi:hypothetical protein